MRMKHKASRQSGNILIYILGAIFLLGILIVITKGNYQPGTGIDAEAVVIKVSEVRRYASELERGVQFVMQNGISETDIRFAHPNAASAYGTYGTNPKAEIFHPQGGGVEWKDPPSGVQVSAKPWYFIGANAAKGSGSTCNQSSCSDLIAFLPDVTQAFCIQVNNSTGVQNPSNIPPKEAGSAVVESTQFAGTFTYAQTLDTTGEYITSKKEGCFEGNGASATLGLAGHYYYYKILSSR